MNVMQRNNVCSINLVLRISMEFYAYSILT